MKKVNDFAEAMGITKGTAYKWIREGRVKVVKLTTAKRQFIRIPDEELEKIKREGIK